MVDFAVNVARFVEKAKRNAELAFRDIGLQAVDRVKSLTPVKTGFLRANWIDTLSADLVPKPNSSQPAGQAIVRAKVGDTIYVVNPVVYARRIEYGFVGTDKLGRHYNQPGRHMVRQTVEELPAIAEQVLKDISG